jgi:hypothetical protein
LEVFSNFDADGWGSGLSLTNGICCILDAVFQKTTDQATGKIDFFHVGEVVQP